MTVFCVRSISFKPLVGFTNNFAQMSSMMRRCAVPVWLRSVQGQGHNLRLNIVRVYFVSDLYLLNPCWDLQKTLHNVKYDGTMCSDYVWPRSVQGQVHSLRFNILWLYLVSTLYLLNPCWYLQITLLKCQLCWDDVQCLCLTKVGSRSRSEFKIKHCMTVFHVSFISFEPLVGFTNYSAQMSIMIIRCAVPMFDQCLFKVKVTV